MYTGDADSLSLRRYGASPGSHSHVHFQILLGLAGTLELEIDGHGLRVSAGAGCVIAPRAQHDFESTHGSLCLVLDSYHSDWEVHAQQQPLHVPPPAWALAQYLGHAIAQDHRQAQIHGPALLLEAWNYTPPLSPTARQRRPIDWQALQQWAAGQWHRPLTVADLAARVHLSPSQFAARCRIDQGTSAMAWLRDLRLSQARSLRAQGLPVAIVAERTGYRSPSALTAALRRASIAPSPSADNH